MYVTTEPGFSSRSTDHRTSQFSQRDQRMNEHEEAGWSNSEPAQEAPESVYPDVEDAEELEPGFSNGKAVASDEPAAESKVVEDDNTEDKSVKPAAKKSAAKKKG